jgi:hypothetical protein
MFSYTLRGFPASVYPGEMQDECPEADADIAALFLQMARQGPSPAGYRIKSLGQKMRGLWQINLRTAGRQVRILDAPYGNDIVLFRIHKKSSPQEQNRAYELAIRRKRQYEGDIRNGNRPRSRAPY